MYLKRTVFLVVGLSKSGTGITELLLQKGAKCYVYDDNENDRVKANVSALTEKGAIEVGKTEVFALLRKIGRGYRPRNTACG